MNIAAAKAGGYDRCYEKYDGGSEYNRFKTGLRFAIHHRLYYGTRGICKLFTKNHFSPRLRKFQGRPDTAVPVCRGNPPVVALASHARRTIAFDEAGRHGGLPLRGFG